MDNSVKLRLNHVGVCAYASYEHGIHSNKRNICFLNTAHFLPSKTSVSNHVLFDMTPYFCEYVFN